MKLLKKTNYKLVLFVLFVLFVLITTKCFNKENFDSKTNFVKTKFSSVEYKLIDGIKNENYSSYYKNIYFYNSEFFYLTENEALTLKPVSLDSKYNMFWTPKLLDEKEFNIMFKDKLSEIINISTLCCYYNPSWRSNPGHALFDGLYPIFVVLCMFNKENQNFYNIFLENDKSLSTSQSEDFLQKFSGKDNRYFYKNGLKKNTLYCIKELVSGIGQLGQRITTYNLNLPGNIKYNALKKYVDRFYVKYNLTRNKYYKKKINIINIIIIDNKRYSENDKKIFNQIITDINNTIINNKTINIKYINFKDISLFKNQLELINNSNIYISSIGTGLMLMPFLPKGSVFINLGYNYDSNYVTYFEQYMSGSSDYIKSLYLSKKNIQNGYTYDNIKKIIIEGIKYVNNFKIPLDTIDNLSNEGKRFINYCKNKSDDCIKTLTHMNIPDKSHNDCILNAWVDHFDNKNLWGSDEQNCYVNI